MRWRRRWQTEILCDVKSKNKSLISMTNAKRTGLLDFLMSFPLFH